MSYYFAYNGKYIASFITDNGGYGNGITVLKERGGSFEKLFYFMELWDVDIYEYNAQGVAINREDRGVFYDLAHFKGLYFDTENSFCFKAYTYYNDDYTSLVDKNGNEYRKTQYYRCVIKE